MGESLSGRFFYYMAEARRGSVVGTLGYKHTPAAREKMRQAHSTPEAKARDAVLGRKNLGRTLTDEHKAKIGAANLGSRHTPEAKAKMSAARWKGDAIKYEAAHVRARKSLVDEPCAHADDTCKGVLQAAFKHDPPSEFVKQGPDERYYSARPEDYTPLCASHHKRYDDLHRGRLEAEDVWMAQEELGPADFESAPPEDEPHDPNIRAEEEREYRRAVS